MARAHYWLGKIYEQQNRQAEAQASYAASLTINPNQKDVEAARQRLSK
ncbi:MAG: tetratricopeptide repeat protein [Thermoanaerobaculia bacterium]